MEEKTRGEGFVRFDVKRDGREWRRRWRKRGRRDE